MPDRTLIQETKIYLTSETKYFKRVPRRAYLLTENKIPESLMNPMKGFTFGASRKTTIS